MSWFKGLLFVTAVVVVVGASASAEAQLFRRFRSNSGFNQAPQVQQQPGYQQQMQQPNYRPPERFNTPPVQPNYQGRPAQQPPTPQLQAPQPTNGSFRLVYDATGRVVAVPSNRPATAVPPANAANSNTNLTGGQPSTTAENGTVTVRVVTYYDPTTGRTFQRRFLMQNPASTSVAAKGNAAVRQPVAIPGQVLRGQTAAKPNSNGKAVIAQTSLLDSPPEFGSQNSSPTAELIPSSDLLSKSNSVKPATFDEEVLPPLSEKKSEEFSVFNTSDDEPASLSVLSEPTLDLEADLEASLGKAVEIVPAAENANSLELDLPALSGPKK